MNSLIAWDRFPILRYVLFFIAGISLYTLKPNIDTSIFYGLGVLSFSLGIISVFLKQVRIVSGVNWLVLIFICGFLVSKTKDPQQAQNHLLHKKLDNLDGLEVKIIDTPTDKTKYSRVLLSVEGGIDSNSVKICTGKILAYIERDSLYHNLNYGDRLLIKKLPQRVGGAKNPYGFDYGEYLASQDIFHQVFLKSKDYTVLNSKAGSDFYAFSLNIRAFLRDKLQTYFASPVYLSVAEALLLGSRAHLDTETKNAFIDAGAIHVLAVSGLHVGIIYEVLLWILQFFKKTEKGRLLIFVITVSFLFGYAIITGLSPSVLRSVLMFSLLAASQLINRKSNTYNTLALSALILLIIKPDMLFDIGFQMSYAAVFGIVYFYPLLTRQVHFNTKLANWLYQLSCVSVSAQITTLPLGLYYFHQFPNYFLFSNPVVIFLVTIILYSGLSFFALSWVPILAKYVAIFTEFLLGILVNAVSFVQTLPGAVSTYISFEIWQLILASLMILILIALIETPRKWLALTMGICIIFWAVISFMANDQAKSEKSLTFYSHSEDFLIAFVNNGQIYSNMDVEAISDPYLKKDFLTQKMFQKASLQVQNQILTTVLNGISVGVFEEQVFLIAEKYPAFEIPEVDWVVLHSIKDANQDIDNFKARQGFILAGNIPFYAKRKLKDALEKTTLKVIDLGEKAATFKFDQGGIDII